MAERTDRIGELYAAHIEEATRLAFLLTGDRVLAEDLAQDAFVKAAGRFQHLRDEAVFANYLWKTVLNECRSYWRRRKVEGRYLDRLRRQGTRPTPAPDVGTRIAVMEALDGLPARQRTAVVLRHYLDLSERRTADLMGCSVGTVKTLTSRGLRTIRERMEP